MNRKQEPRAIVLQDALEAAMPTGAHAYEVDAVPGANGGPEGDLPARYVTYELSRRWHSERRGDADMIPGWSLITHYHAPSISAGRKLRDCVTEAVEGVTFDLPDGDTFGPFAFEFDDGFGYVDGRWVAFDGWTA